jgi:hypothetical protein
MPDVTVKTIDDMEAIYGGLARRARAELGVTAWGMQVFNLPPDWDGYPNHNHSSDAFDPNQEEVYIPLTGSATLVADGDEFELRPETRRASGPSSCAGSSPVRRGSGSWRSAAPRVPSHRERGRSSAPIPPTRRLSSVARAMEEQAFAHLIEPHRRATPAAVSGPSARRSDHAKRRACIHHCDPAPSAKATRRGDPARRSRLVGEGSR